MLSSYRQYVKSKKNNIKGLELWTELLDICGQWIKY